MAAKACLSIIWSKTPTGFLAMSSLDSAADWVNVEKIVCDFSVSLEFQNSYQSLQEFQIFAYLSSQNTLIIFDRNEHYKVLHMQEKVLSFMHYVSWLLQRNKVPCHYVL